MRSSNWIINRFLFNTFLVVFADTDHWPKWVCRIWQIATSSWQNIPSSKTKRKKNWITHPNILNRIHHNVINRLDTIDINLIISHPIRFDLFFYHWNWDYQVNCNCWICDKTFSSETHYNSVNGIMALNPSINSFIVCLICDTESVNTIDIYAHS